MTSGHGTRLTPSTTQSGHRSSAARYVRRRRRWMQGGPAAGRAADVLLRVRSLATWGLSGQWSETNDEDVGTTNVEIPATETDEMHRT